MTQARCHGCGRPAEITDRFTLASTSGDVEHVKVRCDKGHWFTLRAEDVEPRPRELSLLSLVSEAGTTLPAALAERARAG
jgi:hypothetical protein